MSKGSKQRPTNKTKFNDNWEKIFGKTTKKRDHENLSDTNIRKVIDLLNGQAPISKKEACSILNIAYNTTRLQRIIDDFEETQAYREKRKLQNKGKAATKDEVADAVTRFLSGDPISDIASGLYRSAGFIKAIIERVGVPQKQEGVYDYLPEECVAEDFTVGEIVWSAKYHGPAIIRAELSVDYQAERPGYRDVNYEKKYGAKAYNIWVIEKWMMTTVIAGLLLQVVVLALPNLRMI